MSDVAETDAPVSTMNRCCCCVIELKVEDLREYNMCLIISVDSRSDSGDRNSDIRCPWGNRLS